MDIADAIVLELQRLLPPSRPHPLHEPSFEGREWAYLKDCLDTGYVSYVGRYVDRFEEALAAYTGAGRAVAVVNGTAAIQVALRMVGVERDTEVLLPSLTFIGTANPVAHLGAVPHFVDVDPHTLCLCPERLEAHLSRIAAAAGDGAVNRTTGRRLAACVPVHIFGHPADTAGLNRVLQRYGIPLVEDAAEALGSFRNGRHVGLDGRAGILSFNGNKIVTCGGGGAILTNDDALADLARHLTTTAKLPHAWGFFHDMVGYNYRLPNVNAALGCAQMELLPEFLRRKRALAAAYDAAFSGMPGLRFFREPLGCASNYWLCAVLLDASDPALRDAVLQRTRDAGFLTRPAWTPLHRLPMFADSPRAPLPATEEAADRIINLPSGPRLRLREAGAPLADVLPDVSPKPAAARTQSLVPPTT